MLAKVRISSVRRLRLCGAISGDVRSMRSSHFCRLEAFLRLFPHHLALP
jgi:hypothetical protein